MKVSINSYANKVFHTHESSNTLNPQKVQVVLGFGDKNILASEKMYGQLRNNYPVADIVLCSTSGEIFNNRVLDNSVSVTAIEFEKTTIKTASVNIDDHQNNSYEAGQGLVKQLPLSDSLCYIMIISDGGKVNGSELVSGINRIIQHKVPVTGGLAGDGADFISTVAGLNADPVTGKIVAIAFYSKHLIVSHGSLGGWETLGLESTITRSIANQLFEINNENALDVYKRCLGPYAEELPASALMFPLSVQLSFNAEPVVRTILSIDAASKSMVFAGDVPAGSKIRFMKGDLNKLINAASDAANQALTNKPGANKPSFALLISCVGRKIVLDNRVEEEVEAVHEVLGNTTLMSGFYSYGEISPTSANTQCELHNQTMTITTFDEK